MKNHDLLLEAAALFFGLSLISVGGTIGLLPELHRFLVEARGAMTSREFANYVAIAQAAPGPNILYMALFGFHIAGLLGAVVCLTAVTLGPVLMTLLACRAEQKFRDHPWREIVLRGLAPVSIGLLATGVWTISSSFPDWKTWALCLIAFVIFLRTKVHPLWLIAIGAGLGAVIL